MPHAEDKNVLPHTILCVVAHPDDIEYEMGGSLAKWIQDGASVYYLILTNGSRGSANRDVLPDALRKTRHQEQQDAAALLGVRDVFFCAYEDCGLTVSTDVLRDIVRIIRTIKPDTVITLDPTMLYDTDRGYINHPDHRAAGQSTLDSVYPMARDHLSFPDLLAEEHLEPHIVSTVLLVNYARADFFVDISPYIDTKIAALQAHSSQFPDTVAIAERVRANAKETGAKMGDRVTYAESFVRIDIR